MKISEYDRYLESMDICLVRYGSGNYSVVHGHNTPNSPHLYYNLNERRWNKWKTSYRTKENAIKAVTVAINQATEDKVVSIEKVKVTRINNNELEIGSELVVGSKIKSDILINNIEVINVE